MRVYVDGESQPSIDMEIFMGHGMGFKDSHAPWGGSRVGKTGHPSGVYNTYKVPFGSSIRITGQLAYYFNRGRYAHNLAGLTHLDKKNNRFSAYRFHDEDPVFFQNGLTLTNRRGEKIGDKVFHKPPTTTYTTYVWLYQW